MFVRGRFGSLGLFGAVVAVLLGTLGGSCVGGTVPEEPPVDDAPDDPGGSGGVTRDGGAGGRAATGGASGGAGGAAGAVGGAGAGGVVAGAGGAAGAGGMDAGAGGAVPGGAGGTPLGKAWQLPAVTASKPWETFEGYGGKLPIVPWPQSGGWIVSPYGLPVVASLDGQTKSEGSYSLKLDYRLDNSGQAGIGHLYSGLSWAGYDAVRFWMKPDGSRTAFAVNLLNEGGEKVFFEARWYMAVDTPVIVTMPFAAFVDLTNPRDKAAKLNLASIREVTFWFRGTKIDPNKVWTVRVDDFQLVKLEQPLTYVVAWPAPATP